MVNRASGLIRYALFAVGLAAWFTGTGAAANLSPAGLNFGDSPQTVTVSNRGSSTLRLGQIGVVGANVGDFSMTTTCGSVLSAGARTASLVFNGEVGGTPQSVNLTGTGQFMALSADRTHLVNTFTNKPVFITGDTAYNLSDQLASKADIEAYLADRQTKGINLIWVGLVDGNNHGDGKTENDALGNNPWSGGADFTGMSNATAYWDHVDYVLERAAAHGITVLAGTAFAGTFGDCQSPLFATMATSSDATMTAFSAFLGNRYKSYPNIIWLEGGDANVKLCGSALATKVDDIARGVRSADSAHLTAIEATSGVWGEASATNWSSYTWSPTDLNGWITLGTIYPKGTPDKSFPAEIAEIISQSVTETKAVPFVPYFSMEDPYEYEPFTGVYNNQQLRQDGYTEILSGAKLGRLFGSSAVWDFGSSCCHHGPPWQAAMEHQSSFDQQRLGQLFRSREHWKLVADLDHQAVTAGYGSGATLAAASRTSDGQTIIAYIPNGNATALTVDMSKITGATHQATCWWYYPSSGDTTLIGSYADSGTQKFTPPDANDWVLVIDDASANLPAPGSP